MSLEGLERGRIEATDGVVLVTSVGALSTAREAILLTARIERTLRRHGIRRVVFDNRKSPPAEDAARAQMWSWIASCPLVEETSFVMLSSVRQWRVELMGRKRGLRVRGFGSVDEAVRAVRTTGRSSLRRRVVVPRSDVG